MTMKQAKWISCLLAAVLLLSGALLPVSAVRMPAADVLTMSVGTNLLGDDDRAMLDDLFGTH